MPSFDFSYDLKDEIGEKLNISKDIINIIFSYNKNKCHKCSKNHYDYELKKCIKCSKLFCPINFYKRCNDCFIDRFYSFSI